MNHMRSASPNNIAVYWDFENLHISLCSTRYGDNWCGQREHKERQPAILDLDSIMEFINSIGVVNINRAYANWAYLQAYNEPLQSHSIDLIQLFPRTRAGKNGSDIRMSIDIIQDLVQSAHIDTVVLIGGDSDYIAVSQKVRQMGKQIIGIGLQETTSRFFVTSCNEFKFYSSLLVRSSAHQPEADEEAGADLDEAKTLLRKAIQTLTDSSGGNTVVKAAIKPMLVRLDPTFDEGNYGFKTFSKLMEACGDIIRMEKGEFDIMVSLRNGAEPIQAVPVTRYEKILSDQKIRLVTPELLREAIVCTVEMFQKHGYVENYASYKELLGECLTAKGVAHESSDLSKVKAIIFKAFLFSLDGKDKRISLKKDYSAPQKMLVEVVDFLVRRIVFNCASEIDSAEIARLLLGDEKHKPQIDRLIENLPSEGYNRL